MELKSLYFSYFSEIRKDDDVIRLLNDPNVDVFDLQFHTKCYDVYTHSKTLSRIQDRNEASNKENNSSAETEEAESSRRSSQRKRDRGGNFLYH